MINTRHIILDGTFKNTKKYAKESLSEIKRIKKSEVLTKKLEEKMIPFILKQYEKNNRKK